MLGVLKGEVAAAEEAEQQERPDGEEAPPEVGEEKIEELVGRPGVLDRFAEAAATFSRVVGERMQLKLLALVASSAQLDLLPNDKPIAANVILTAGAGRGKNALCDAVVRPMPEGFYLPFESSSAKSFYYMAESNPAFLKHRFIYPNEAEGVDQLVEMFRPLLSGGKARHNTVNKDARGRNVHQQFSIEGPVALAIPTIRNKLDNQLQTRMLLMELEDYKGRVAAHSRAVSGLLSSDYAGGDFAEEIRAWQAALLSLTGMRRVVVPVDSDDFRFSSDEVSHGARLWTNLMGLMCAHAWLEQRNREVMTLPNGEQAIVAAPEDYEAAYRVFEATCERSVKNIGAVHRKILDAVHEMLQEEEDLPPGSFWRIGFSQRKIAQRSGVPQSTISDNKTFLVTSAKLLQENDEGLTLVPGAQPSWWEKGDVLAGFPRPEQVRAWWGSEDGPQDPETPGRPGEDGDIAPDEAVNGDRRPSGHHAEATGLPARDEADRRSDRMANGDDRERAGRENALDGRENASEEGPTGVTGRFGDYYEPEEAIEGREGVETEKPEGTTEDDDRARDEDPWDLWD